MPRKDRKEKKTDNGEWNAYFAQYLVTRMQLFLSDIVVSGRKHYFQADTDGVKSTWINKLLDASRITVSIEPLYHHEIW